MRTIIFALVFGVSLLACGKDDSNEPQHSQSNPPTGGCCKVCTNSQPCGDTCISSSSTCHTGPGCACWP